MNVRHPVGVLHSFSIKIVFYDKIDSRLFYFHVMIFEVLIYGMSNFIKLFIIDIIYFGHLHP